MTSPQPPADPAGDHERAMDRLTMDYPVEFDVLPDAAREDPAES